MGLKMEPVGKVKNQITDRKDTSWGNDISTIMLEEPYISGLKGLEAFSHAIILFWLDQARYDKGKSTCREGRRIGRICRWWVFSLKEGKTGQTRSE